MGHHHYSDVATSMQPLLFAKVALRRAAVQKVLHLVLTPIPGPSRPTAHEAVVPSTVALDGDDLGRVDQGRAASGHNLALSDGDPRSL